jgi:hypothetical protein
LIKRIALESVNTDSYRWESVLEALDGFSPGISLGNRHTGDYNDVFQLTIDRFFYGSKQQKASFAA